MPPHLARAQTRVFIQQHLTVDFVNNALQNNPIVQRTIDLHNLFANNNDTAIPTLATQIRQNPHYAHLTDDMLSEIVAIMRERFPEAGNYTIENWADETVLDRLVALHEYVKTTLQERLHINRVGWGVVSRIVNAVFGNVPVINQNLRRELHDLGYLYLQNTSRLHNIFCAIRDFWQEIAPFIVPMLGNLVIPALGDFIEEVLVQIAITLLKDVWNNYANRRDENQHD